MGLNFSLYIDEVLYFHILFLLEYLVSAESRRQCKLVLGGMRAAALSIDWLSYIVGSTWCGERHLMVLCDNLVYLFQTSPRSYI